MAFSLNRIMLIGHLVRDAETRVTPSNVSVTKFTVVTNHSFKNKDGNFQDETTWHNIVAFSLSDYYLNYLRKGAKLYVEGRLSNREYTDKDGVKKYFTEVIAEKLIPLNAKGMDYDSSTYSGDATIEKSSGVDILNDSFGPETKGGVDDNDPF